jgi:GcrA cell cycle regulator
MKRYATAPVRSPTVKAVPVRQSPTKKPEPIPQDRERPWTETEVRNLRKHIGDGLSYGQICRELPGRTRNMIIGKCRRLGIREVMTPEARRARASQHINAKNFAARMRRGEVISTALDTILQAKATPLEALGDRGCKWPMGDPKAAGFGFCGCDRVGKGNYCEAHMRAAYEPEAPRRKRVERLADVVDGKWAA